MIDENDAPEGYKAAEVPETDCSGCAFDFALVCDSPRCFGHFRMDGHDVIFIKRDPA